MRLYVNTIISVMLLQGIYFGVRAQKTQHHYNIVDTFSENMAVVEIDGYYGFIDIDGKEIIKCRYDYAYPFANGLAQVIKGKKHGFINKTGLEIVPCIYSFARPYAEGVAQAEVNDSCFFLNLSGERVMTCYGTDRDFSEGLAVMIKSGKYGYMDKNSKEVIACRYDFASNFSGEYSRVQINKKWGIINRQGKVCIPIDNDNLLECVNGVVAVQKKELWGFMRINGTFICPFKYRNGDFFCSGNGLYTIQEKNKTLFIYNGRVVNQKGYDATAGTTEGLTRVRINGKRGFVNSKGREVIPCIYEQASYFSSGVSCVIKDGKYFYIDSLGRKLLECEKCEYASDFSEGVAPVKKDNKWGYINKKGLEVLTMQYDGAGIFKDHVAAVMMNKKWGVIDTCGKLIVPCMYDDFIRFQNGYAPVKKEGKMGMIDCLGKEVIPCIYEHVNDVSQNCIQVTQNEKTVYLNLRGEPY